MPLKKSPRGQIRPYTREGVTSLLKKTAKESFLIGQLTKEMGELLDGLPEDPTEEEAEDAMVETELIAMQLGKLSGASAKVLRKALKKVEKYRLENTE